MTLFRRSCCCSNGLGHVHDRTRTEQRCGGAADWIVRSQCTPPSTSAAQLKRQRAVRWRKRVCWAQMGGADTRAGCRNAAHSHKLTDYVSSQHTHARVTQQPGGLCVCVSRLQVTVIVASSRRGCAASGDERLRRRLGRSLAHAQRLLHRTRAPDGGVLRACRRASASTAASTQRAWIQTRTQSRPAPFKANGTAAARTRLQVRPELASLRGGGLVHLAARQRVDGALASPLGRLVGALGGRLGQHDAQLVALSLGDVQRLGVGQACARAAVSRSRERRRNPKTSKLTATPRGSARCQLQPLRCSNRRCVHDCVRQQQVQRQRARRTADAAALAHPSA